MGWFLWFFFFHGYTRIITGYHHTTQQPPRIIEHPLDTTVARHDPATLNCQAQGEPEPTIAWYKDGVLLRTTSQDSRSHRVILPTGNLFFLRVSQGRKESDAGVYWCEASNALGKVKSRNATLTVAVLRDEFRLEPQSGRVAAGEDIIMECSPPRGTPEPQVFWRKDGKTLELGGRLKLVDGFNLAITDSKASDDGRYQCVAKNTAGLRESSVAILKVYVKPFMIQPPKDVTALVGSTIELPCTVGGDPVPDVFWKRQAPGGTMPLGRVRVLEDRSLRLEDISLMDQGRYTCEADNSAGLISASAFVTVHAPPAFTARPSAQTVEVGQQVSFQCHVTGSPKPLIFWSFEGDRTLIYPGASAGNFEAYTSIEGHSTLMLKNAQLQNTGTVIICSAVNEAGSVSTRTRLTVTSKEDRPPPVIVRGPSNQTLPTHSMAFLVCEATGSPKPVISWYKEGVPVAPSNRINMSNPELVSISQLSKEDSGAYTCVASSRGGKATWTGHLLVENPKNPNINFFKAPEAVMVPGPPSRPHAINQSEGSVTISWGQNNKIGSSSLLGYQIELFGREEGVTPTWTVVARRVPGPTFTQHLLTPGIPYTFLVRAENSHGLGPPSPLSEPIVVGPDLGQNWGSPEVTVLSEARASLVTNPELVRLTDAIPVSSTAVKLAWEVVDSTYVEGLYIYYVSIEAAPDVAKGYSMLTVLHTGTTSSFTVNNLEKWARYEFFLIPFYKAIEGQPSNCKTVRTLEDVPTEPPTHMEALLLNSTAVKLKWKPPAPSALNGDLEGYKLELKTNDSATPRVISVGSAPSYLLGNLSSGVLYYVRVAAFTSAGVGPYCPASTLRLDPATRVIDNNMQRPIGADMQPDNFVTETWFMALLISMILVMVILFGAMFFVRRRQLLSKKTMTPSRSNGGVLSTPLATKQETPLWLDKDVPDYATTFPEYSKLNPEYPGRNPEYSNGSLPTQNGNINLHTNPLHAQYNRPDKLEYGSESGYPIGRKYNDYNLLQVQEYASPNVGNERGSQMADYAEVDANIGSVKAGSGSTSPAPYATTTLVTGSRRVLWNASALSTDDESPYPASNGGYYNRKVYSDSYFAPAHTLRRSKKHHDHQHSRKNSQEKAANPPDLVSPNSSHGQPVYARVGPPALSWRNGAAAGLSSFSPGAARHVYLGSSRSEPGSML
ncbi:roundabout homolog 2-like [Anthonomus grandis grandis]|uniref:roundabout homolog 2-like n=1 Tax=Anthonomus grandis grandis TaxID=2921223 RepID=UPI0021666C96|nr:roundabout homolog 2-like [Anthonomus grandis grandis]